MVRAPSTRSRILEEARQIANEVGFDRLTTRELAERCAINEGNLYYYFKTKAQIVRGLFEIFEVEARTLFEAEPLAAQGVTRAGLKARVVHAIDLLRAWCLLSWRYRALLRDGNALFRLAPDMQESAIALNAQLSAQVTGLIMALKHIRALSIEDEAIPALVANIFIVSNYWLGYVIHQTGVSDPDEAHLAWGFGQILALVAPYRTWLTRQIMKRHPEMFVYRSESNA